MHHTNTNTNVDVFISYSSKENDLANKIVSVLESRNLTTWIAPRDIVPGKPYGAEIIRGIDRSKSVLLILTPASLYSKHVRNEVERAISKQKILIPFQIGELELDEEWEYYISSSHRMINTGKLNNKTLLQMVDKIVPLLKNDENLLSINPNTKKHRSVKKAKFILYVLFFIIASGLLVQRYDFIFIEDQITSISNNQVNTDDFSESNVPENITQNLNDVPMTMESAISHLGSVISGTVNKTGKIKIEPLKLHQTDYISPFSVRFVAELENKIKNQSILIGNDDSFIPDYLLDGYYLENDSTLRVFMNLKNNKGEIVARNERQISKSDLEQNNIVFKFSNQKEAIELHNMLHDKPLNSNDIKAKIWTNKGFKDLIFKENEIMKLFVNVNASAYLRIIYYMADGSKVLLLDNYFIHETMVNENIELPYEFECAAPFGLESIHMLVQSKPFPLLETFEKYGYMFLKEDMEALSLMTKGFRKKENSMVATESILELTTFQ
jgi:hypothetical protein